MSKKQQTQEEIKESSQIKEEAKPEKPVAKQDAVKAIFISSVDGKNISVNFQNVSHLEIEIMLIKSLEALRANAKSENK